MEALEQTVAAPGMSSLSRRPLAVEESAEAVEENAEFQPPFEAIEEDFGRPFMVGLTLAGVASVLMTTVFGLFHVDVFLRVYELPLSTYATGSLIFSVINTANDLAGAWWVDSKASKSSRSEIIGISGCVFAACFLTPFFRWKAGTQAGLWDGAHFVASMSLYDTLYSFTAILMGSVVTDNHKMSDRDRVNFMASGKIANLVASFGVARIGLAVFQTEDMSRFRLFLVLLSFLVCIMFLGAHSLMKPGVSWKGGRLQYRKKPIKRKASIYDRPKKKLQLSRVVRDFWSHDNFRAWIGMEMLLECQNTFLSSFLKTFVDRLVFDAGVSRGTCDWLLSLIRPLKQVLGILCYIPIRSIGYQRVYTWMFGTNLVLSIVCLLTGSPSATNLIVAFLVIHSTLTGAVQGAGFHLAMSDLVLEMKNKHALERRFDEPSLAGMFMGANALLCKPMESFLPIVAATVLGKTQFSTENENSESARWVLFYLLLVPPMVFSCLQLLSWRRYDLHPGETKRMREELKQLHSSLQDEEEAAGFV